LSSLADDIRDVYAEIGSRIHVLNGSTWTDDAYIDTEQDMGSPYLRRAFFPVSSAAVPGSIVRIPSVNADFLMLTRIPGVFEDAPYEYESLLFMVNVTAIIVRLSHERDASTYRQTVVESEVRNPAYGFMSPGTVTLTAGRTGNMILDENDLYIPAAYNAAAGDRVKFDNEERQIESIRLRDYPGVAICRLSTDSR
jgi:hypothetical protein